MKVICLIDLGCVRLCMFVWRKECYNMRVVLTEPLIRMGVSESTGRRRKGRTEGRPEFLSNTTAASPSLRGSAKPLAYQSKFPEAKGLRVGGGAVLTPYPLTGLKLMTCSGNP